MLKVVALIIYSLALVACVGAEENDSWVVKEDTWDLNPEMLESFKALFTRKKIDGSFHLVDEARVLGDREHFEGEFIHEFPGTGEWSAYRNSEDFSAFYLVDENSNILAVYLYPFLVLNIFSESFKSSMEKGAVLSLITQYVMNTDTTELDLRSESNARSIYTNADSTYAYYSSDFTNSLIAEAGNGYVSIGFLLVRDDDSSIPGLDLNESKYWVEEASSPSGDMKKPRVDDEP